MANFNQSPLGQAAVSVSMGATFYDASPLGIGTITPAQTIDVIDASFRMDIAGTSQLRLPLGGGGDTRPSVGLVYPR